MRPKPVTKPSPAGRCSCMPKSTQLWRTNLSSSSKVPSSSSRLMRSRAASFPALCSRSRRSGPPPASASADWRRSSSMRSCCFSLALTAAFFSGKLSSHRRRLFVGKNSNGKMRCKPDGAKQQDNAEEKLRANGHAALERRLKRRNVIRRLHQNEHRPEGHRNDEGGGHDKGEDHFHESSTACRSRREKDSATEWKSESGS